MSILVDTNIILDVITGDPVWKDWSQRSLSALSRSHELVVNPVICAELSCKLRTEAELDVFVPASRFKHVPLPVAAAFPAGRAFAAYRKRGGVKTSPLPDFFIGAHAWVEGHTLLTRDASRYRTYFPKLKIIAP